MSIIGEMFPDSSKGATGRSLQRFEKTISQRGITVNTSFDRYWPANKAQYTPAGRCPSDAHPAYSLNNLTYANVDIYLTQVATNLQASPGIFVDNNSPGFTRKR